MERFCHIPVFYHLRYERIIKNLAYYARFFNDPYGIRTRVTAVKGRCLNRLTNGPYGGEGGI